MESPFISFELGVDFDNLMYDCPIELEYESYNKEYLLRKLKDVSGFGASPKKLALKELN